MVCACKWDLGHRQLRRTVWLLRCCGWTGHGPGSSDELAFALGSSHFPREALLALGEALWIPLVLLPSVVADNHRVAAHMIAVAF